MILLIICTIPNSTGYITHTSHTCVLFSIINLGESEMELHGRTAQNSMHIGRNAYVCRCAHFFHHSFDYMASDSKSIKLFSIILIILNWNVVLLFCFAETLSRIVVMNVMTKESFRELLLWYHIRLFFFLLLQNVYGK